MQGGRASRTASRGTKPIVVTYTRLHLPRVAVTPAIRPSGPFQRPAPGAGLPQMCLTRELVFDYKQLE